VAKNYLWDNLACVFIQYFEDSEGEVMSLYLIGTFAVASLLLLATPGPDSLAVLGRELVKGGRLQ
jgi:hypothetical protein